MSEGGEVVSETSTTTSSQFGSKNSKRNGTTKSPSAKKTKNNNGSQERNYIMKKETSPVPLESQQDGSTTAPSYLVVLSPRGLNSGHHHQHHHQEEELKLSDTDLANVKFKMSPSEAMLYVQSASTSVPQLFKYDSLENINEKYLGSPQEKVAMERGSVSASNNARVASPTGASIPTSSASVPTSSAVPVTTATSSGSARATNSFKAGVDIVSGKRGPRDQYLEENGHTAVTRKKQRVEPITLGHYQASSSSSSSLRVPSSNLSTPPMTPHTPITPTHPHSQASSRVNSPDIHNNNLSAYNSPYVTPHGTPVHTPHQSPLPSPTKVLHPPNYHHPMSHGLPSSHQSSSPMSGSGGARIHPGDDQGNNPSYQMMGCSSSTLRIPGYGPQLHFGHQQPANPGMYVVMIISCVILAMGSLRF